MMAASVIDTSGMRTLNVGDAANGIEVLSPEITQLAPCADFPITETCTSPGAPSALPSTERP